MDLHDLGTAKQSGERCLGGIWGSVITTALTTGRKFKSVLPLSVTISVCTAIGVPV